MPVGLTSQTVCAEQQDMPCCHIGELTKASQEWWHIIVTSSPECVLRLTTQQPEREGRSRFKLEAITVRPRDTGRVEGLISGIDSRLPKPGSEFAFNYEQSLKGNHGGKWRKEGSGQ